MGERHPNDHPSEPTPRIDTPLLRDIRDRLRNVDHFESVEITAAEGQKRLNAVFDPSISPPAVKERFLDIRWYTNDDFRIHYQENWNNHRWMQRWDRHPNEHNDREHFHPPPDASTPGNNQTWPRDYRDVMSQVISSLNERTSELWAEVQHE